ncbi:magnesium/cobalt transporter CorA [Neokomagataea thailandica NBRC 106555]|uniref:Magnesium transport protein CorA n=2 Tax=Neokomagataea TaxID=1223423 RepID=A0A4Y6V7H2_9PROT|nr:MULTISPECIES: magnesium transporter CorA family protein [Neokomagataea]QDH24476.1 magnesium transporter [Neokomagataea tanensis]GBR55525.1 magnesium/cobalt transporter CorA [Neokomagataea thailandica NBRC 106555]
MLLTRPTGTPAYEMGPHTRLNAIPWIDLLNPTEEEINLASEKLGFHIPSRAELNEIESSSRHYEREGILYLSGPLVRRYDTGPITRPVGFVVSPTHLVTIRYADYIAFDAIGLQLAEHSADAPPPSPAGLLTDLIDEIINRLADLLENVGHTLDTLSRQIFGSDERKHRAHASHTLRTTLKRLGNTGDLASMIRDSLLSIDRIRLHLSTANKQDLLPTHITNPAEDSSSKLLHNRLEIAGRDITSLNEFNTQINNKVQFLLDATLGFINIEQNDGMKILTVASSIGIMPTLIAGIYGMNFRIMPELNWSFGYPFAIALMLVSIAAPLYWFWRRGWLTRL